MTKVMFELNDPELPQAESLHASFVKKNRYRLENVPFYAREVSLGDTIECVERNGELWYRKTVEKSGNGTIRIFCDSGFKAGKGKVLVDRLEHDGFIFEFLGEKLAAGCIPLTFEDLGALEGFLSPQVDDDCFYEISDW
jgi:hypothetical protein